MSDRVREALANRVERYKDELAEALLACLVGLDGLHAGFDSQAPAQALVAVALAELTGAGRLITFSANADDRALSFHPHKWGPTPARPAGPLLESLVGPRAELAGSDRGDLLDRLEELQQEVILAADVQGYIDANANERAYLRAATRIARAAEHIGAACVLAGLSGS